MNDMELTNLIRSSIEAELAAGNVVSKGPMIHKIVYAQGPAMGKAADFYTATAYAAVSRIVGDLIRHSKADDGDLGAALQMVMPGWEELKKNYSLVRDGERKLVPLKAMTIAECKLKAAELRVHAAGAMKHADELLAYALELESANSTQVDN
jgi:hypothetical protein